MQPPRWLLAIVVLAVGCANSRPAMVQPSGGALQFSLPAPAVLAPRHTSAYTSSLSGSAHLAAPLSRVSDNGGAASYQPQWGGALLTDAAFAVYSFSLPGYSSPEVLTLNWNSAPSAYDEYVGVSDFLDNRWEWQRVDNWDTPGTTGTVRFADPQLQKYRQSGTDTVLVAVLLLGKQAAELQSLGWGGQNPTPADVTFRIDPKRDVHPISPLIYGVNQPDWAVAPATHLARLGGNRWTAYNWENNASNAGSDYIYQNDDYLSSSDAPGEAVRERVQDAFDHNASMLVTVPIQGYCAADKAADGDVRNSGPDYLQTRFRQNQPVKGSPFEVLPDLGDAFVYQDEFVYWLRTKFPRIASGPQIYYSLDNEPDLWAETHAEVHPDAPTYDELVQRTIDYANAIKDVDPQALIFGPVSYGWYGYTTLQGAPDSTTYGDFLDYYLDRMAQADAAGGRRLLDVLDLHWYPEAQGGGVRITEDDTSPAVVAARLQAPRSLWDPSYVEDSWISQNEGAVYLIPRMQAKIAAHYPGTRLSISEYNYGAGGDISGGLAEADALGVFGREDLYAACMWEMSADNSFIMGALNMFTDFDGAGGHFLDRSIHADSSDVARATVYASYNNTDDMVLVAINKTDTPLDAAISYSYPVPPGSAKAWQLTAASATPQPAPNPDMWQQPTIRYTLPPMSVTTITSPAIH